MVVCFCRDLCFKICEHFIQVLLFNNVSTIVVVLKSNQTEHAFVVISVPIHFLQ